MRYRDFGLDGASDSEKNSFSANIVSLLQAGCFFGSLAAAPVGDKLGRRLALGLGAIAFIVGSTMQTASAGNKPVMFVGRAIGGIVCVPELGAWFVSTVLTVLREWALLACWYPCTQRNVLRLRSEADSLGFTKLESKLGPAWGSGSTSGSIAIWLRLLRSG